MKCNIKIVAYFYNLTFCIERKEMVLSCNLLIRQFTPLYQTENSTSLLVDILSSGALVSR